MSAQERVQAVAEFGFTERQARFLVTVMQHSGLCLLRHYSAYAGIVHGQKTRAFFEKLVSGHYASAHACRHNRGRVYHVHFYPLYKAIGEPHSRYRRPVAAGRVAERLLMLDAVLATSGLEWLASTTDKVTYFTSLSAPVPVEHLPRATAKGNGTTPSVFPDRLPIGIDPSGRVILLYVAFGGTRDAFRPFLRRYRALLQRLPAWTLKVVFPRALAGSYHAYQEMVCEEWDSPLHPRLAEQLGEQFEERRKADEQHRPWGSDLALLEGIPELIAHRLERLYQRWLRDGCHVLEEATSSALKEALASRTGRLECLVLSHSYSHLSPLVGKVRAIGDQGALKTLPSRENDGQIARSDVQSTPIAMVGG